MSANPPVKLLIAAMGGEGGGVLTDWIVSAARAEGLAVQATSIPGVAQRTGATTYYIEIVPQTLAAGAPQPVLSLYPVLGDVDLMVATEILEAARAVANGFVTPDRTTLIASTHRVFSVAEKSSMGDGRLDLARMLRVCRDRSQAAILFDMSEAAQSAGSVLNAVLLGALAGSGKLPMPVARLEAAISAEGKSVDSNLAGFAFGLAHAQGQARALAAAIGTAPEKSVAAPSDAATRAAAEFDGPQRELIAQAVARLIDYQDDDYAQFYLRRLIAIRDAERHMGGDGSLVRDIARHLAVRMCFDDVTRVAQLKTAAGRFDQVRREVRAKDNEPIAIVDYFKPGIEELCSMLPPTLALPILRLAERRGWLGRAYLGLHVKSNTVLGYARLKFLAWLRRFRRGSHRYIEEQKAIQAWLDAVARGALVSLPLAAEIAECARLIKGYGDTHKRSTDNWRRILDGVIAPALDGRLKPAPAADAVANARIAALADPTGAKLQATLAAIAAQSPALGRAAE